MERILSKKEEKVIKEMMEGRLFEHLLALVAKVGMRMMSEVALEEEVTEALRRDHCEKVEGRIWIQEWLQE